MWLVYTATAFPGVGGRINPGDSAKFQFISSVGGVSHPPGNPLYLLVSLAASRLFWFVEPATVGTQISVVCAAGALALLFDALRRYQGQANAAVAVACIGLGPLFWTLGTEAEVYALNALLLAAAIRGIALWDTARDTRALAVGLSAFVLAFGNHGSIVACLPAFVLVAVMVHRRAGVPRYYWAVGSLATLLVALMYLYIPWRARVASYTELQADFSRQELWDYLRAKQFAESLSVPSFVRLTKERIPEAGRHLRQQWLWPQLLLIGAGAVSAWRSARPLAVFCLFAALGVFGFTAVYDISDPEGFYVPASVALGCFFAFTAPPGRRRLAPLPILSLLMLVPPASAHLDQLARSASHGVFEAVAGDPVLWDLPDVIERLPPGSRLVLPCSHYGCVEAFNYYRFADKRARAKHLEFVRMRGGATYPLPAPPPLIWAKEGRTIQTCTLSKSDAWRMQKWGVQVTTIERPGRVVGGALRPGAPIYCSTPSGD